MQVYITTWEGQVRRTDCFRNFADIEPSIRLSYSKAKDLKIDVRPTKGPVEFHVSGIWDDGKAFSFVMTATRYSVWDSPTHL
jgi:hypothetical protein